MLDAIGSAMSGLQAQALKMDSTANNVANSQSADYTPSRVNLSETEQGGVAAQLEKAVTAPNADQNNAAHASQVNLAKEMTTMVETKNMYQANMKTMETEDNMVGNLLDTIG